MEKKEGCPVCGSETMCNCTVSKEGKLIVELKYETDNRDSRTTWLQISTQEGEYLGYIELSLDDMFELIRNVIENMEGV